MIYRSNKNPNSHLTIKKRRWPSFPTKFLFSNGFIKGKTLDFGCGLGLDINYLKNKDIDITGYDPYYLPEYPKVKFDTIICNYVLNVLLKDEQTNVLMAISELLKPEGKAYISVRRDIKRDGFRFNPYHNCKTYQCNVVLPYKSIFYSERCEIYEYQHYNSLKHKNPSCIFCNPEPDRTLITESATFYSIYDKYPVNNGHALLIPKRHITSYFDINFNENYASFLMLKKVREILQVNYNPDGFNIGVNVGASAGQTIEHLHIHMIPRYKGDCENPVGGIRNIFPEKSNYFG